MAGVFEIEGIDAPMQHSTMNGGGAGASGLAGANAVDEDNDIVIADDELTILTDRGGPEMIREMNASMMKDPSMEALELSESTVHSKAGKAGPSGKPHKYIISC